MAGVRARGLAGDAGKATSAGAATSAGMSKAIEVEGPHLNTASTPPLHRLDWNRCNIVAGRPWLSQHTRTATQPEQWFVDTGPGGPESTYVACWDQYWSSCCARPTCRALVAGNRSHTPWLALWLATATAFATGALVAYGSVGFGACVAARNAHQTQPSVVGWHLRSLFQVGPRVWTGTAMLGQRFTAKRCRRC